MTYIALLRGINVGGGKAIRMPELLMAFEGLGFKKVVTYVQSGNVVFEGGDYDPKKIALLVENAIKHKFGFKIKVIIRTAGELEKIVSGNPLLKHPEIEFDKLHITFLANMPDERLVLKLHMPKKKNEQYTISGREVYLHCPDGYGKTRLNNQAFEKKLAMPATTRNWKTINALLEISKSKNL